MCSGTGSTAVSSTAGRRGSGRHAVLLSALLILGGMVPLTVLAVARQAPADPLFVPGDQCMACHNGLTTATGEDVSIGLDWRGAMMANAARDPYWQAAVRREIMDHPESRAAIEDKCSTCHMPMARFEAKSQGGAGQVFVHLPIGSGTAPMSLLAADGVSCLACHQIQPVGLGRPESFTGGFVMHTPSRLAFGPFDVRPGPARIMRSATGFLPAGSAHVQSSELCGSCHVLYTHSLGPGGKVTGELPEQTPYLEWLHSDHAREERSCQSCHMPVVPGSMAVSSVMGTLREGFSRHVFRGGNFFMPKLLNLHRAELGVAALPQELELVSKRTAEHLSTSAAAMTVPRAEVADGRLEAEVMVVNLAGHKLPTAYPSRRAWLRLTVRDAGGKPVFESGAPLPTGAIAGNDNDADPLAYEPHYRTITDPGQVQIYESVMAGPDGTVTTGLLTAVRYVKDNRLLPRGFDKAGADEDVAVYGPAVEDPDFEGGGDRVLYRVPVGEARGPFTVEAELWYQPIAFRWARNLAAYDAPETRRFALWYDALAGSSAIRLARAEARTGGAGAPGF